LFFLFFSTTKIKGLTNQKKIEKEEDSEEYVGSRVLVFREGDKDFDCNINNDGVRNN